MIIGTAELFLGLMVLLVFALAYIAYTLIKQLRTLEKNQARRISDIMVIGSILYWLNIFIPQERGGEIKIQATAGMLILLYGYGLLVLEKYREGRRGFGS